MNGDTYEGEWKNHKRHGRGTYTFVDLGVKYCGSWKDGIRDGHGELIQTGCKFSGKFKNDLVGLMKILW